MVVGSVYLCFRIAVCVGLMLFIIGVGCLLLTGVVALVRLGCCGCRLWFVCEDGCGWLL